MDRYDWEWGRRMWGPAGSRYDRYGGYDRHAGYGPYGGGPGGYDGPPGGGYGRYDGWYGGGQPGPGRGYRYSYDRPGSGWRGRFGRQEPWEPGPPSGFGRQWGAAYGNRYDQYERYRPETDPYARRGPFDPFGRDSYADLPDAPRGYYDGYDPEMDDEEIDAVLGPDRGMAPLPWEGEEPDDHGVRGRVMRALRDDGFIDAEAIQVEVKDRVVTLRGEVKDYMEARYAWDDAWEAGGVRGVISKLTVPGAGRQEAPAGAAKKKR